MNRFQLRTQSCLAKSDRSSQLDQSIVQASEYSGLHYTLFAPLHYEPKYAYPLLIWLHGPGDDERQLQRIMPLISMRNYVAVGPRGPQPSSTGPGHAWTQADCDVFAAEMGVFKSIEIVREKYNIANHRVFLGGYQSGGTMAFRLALKYPNRFAGALSIGGAFPMGNSPLLNLEQSRHLSLFIAHCRDSQSYPVDQACAELRLFHAAGMHVTLRQYPCDDEMNTKMLHDVDVWLMEQITGTPCSEADDLTPQPGEEN